MVPTVTRRARQVISLIRYLREMCVSCGRIPTPAPITVFPLPRSHMVAVIVNQSIGRVRGCPVVSFSPTHSLVQSLT